VRALRPELQTVVALLGLAAVASACATGPIATVQDRSAPVRQPESVFRQVQTGDTLYSIAWESGRDYRDLARWNDLDPPYLIKPGQKIRLFLPPGARRQATTGDGYRVVVKGDTLYGIAQEAGVPYSDLAAWNRLAPPYTIAPGQRLRLTPPDGAVNAPSTSRRAASAKPKSFDDSERAGPAAWRWPADGKIIARFAPDDGAKGIDIAGSSGQPIYAAASGKVVYQGSGLRGYGQLIIVKHNVDFLSAYAHCAAIYAQEGSVIKPGQKIAAMGSSGTDRVKLHFEIRRRGVPVDPLSYLPKK
jgi:lipoprotein NlpD